MLVLGILASVELTELQHSSVSVKYEGDNTYTVTLKRRDTNGRVESPFNFNPTIRFTNTCNTYSYSYCGMKEDSSFSGGEVVGAMSHTSDGIYTYTADLEDRTGVFTPIIYGELDDNINGNKFLANSNLLTSDEYEEVLFMTLTGGDITVTGSPESTSGNKQLYSMLLYSTTAGDRTITYTHNNCMSIKINGESKYEAPPN